MATWLSPRGTTAQPISGGSRRKFTRGQIGWSAASAEGHFHLATAEA